MMDLSRRPSEEIRMTSPAQRKYAEAIVKYFGKHPEAGADLAVADVLADMDAWVLRHKLHKEGEAWLPDEDLADVRAEVRRVGERVRDRQRDLNRANNGWMHAPRGSDARAGARAAAAEAAEKLEVARGLARKAVEGLLEAHGDKYRAEVLSLATSFGALS
jgi:hypothetical protein